MDIKILDCTLRDGGYINNWKFDNKIIKDTVNYLSKANIDIIECGFLDKNGKNENFTRFKNIDSIKYSNSNINKDTVIMIEKGNYDLKKLPLYNKQNNINGIRYSFRKSDYISAINDMKIIKEKGYKLFIQIISTKSYTKEELRFILNKVNILKPYAVYIVDTKGSMLVSEFLKLYEIFENILDKNIKIGFHSHNNMQLSYAIAIEFIQQAKRDIIIDSSIYGMGRGAGNLNTELLADFINKNIQNKYNIDYLLYLIDKYYLTLFNKFQWGYSLEYFLSASYECHPNYINFLVNKKHLLIKDIKQILSTIPENEKNEFNQKIIENIYYQFNGKKYSYHIKEPIFDKTKQILIVGPGPNLNEKIQYIKNNKNNFTIITLNFIPNDFDIDYVFFNSQKRYNTYIKLIDKTKIIISSNVKANNFSYILDYSSITKLNQDTFNDNAIVMLINYLKNQNFTEILLAGIDGFKADDENYRFIEYDKVIDKNEIDKLNKYILTGLQKLSKEIKITFLTDSIFKYKLPLKVIGVIPARFGSTRLPGKPLKDICGLPMIIHTFKRAKMSKKLDELYIATDDKRIYNEVLKYGGKAIMTSNEHQNGTLRMYEVSQKINGDMYILINGDEALLNPKHIDISIENLKNSKADISILYNKFYKKNSPSDFKIVLNQKNEVMYISRSDIPSDYKTDVDFHFKAYHIMGFKNDILSIYPNIKETRLDKIESHELLRLIENSYKVLGIEVESSAISVDTQEDLEYVRSIMCDDEIFQLYKDIK